MAHAVRISWSSVARWPTALDSSSPSGFALELRSPAGVNLIELGVATRLRGFQSLGDQPSCLQPMECRIERCPREANHLRRQSLAALDDAEAMHRPRRDRLQHQHVERGLRQAGSGGRHSAWILLPARGTTRPAGPRAHAAGVRDVLYSDLSSIVVGVRTARTAGARQAATATPRTTSVAEASTAQSCGATS